MATIPTHRAPRRILEGREIRELVESCCARQHAVLVTATNSGRSYPATFARFTSGTVSFDAVVPGRRMPLRERTLCVVSFGDGRRAHGFLTNVLAIASHGPGKAQVMVELPDRMTAMESRLSFRVPVAARSGLALRLQDPSLGEIASDAVDVSLIGAGVRLPPGSAPLEIGQAVRVQLALAGDEVELQAEVRRRVTDPRGSLYGVMYPNAVTADEVKAPGKLTSIVGRLERLWLQRRSM